MLSPVLAPLLASVLLLGACGDDGDDAKADDDKSSSASPNDDSEDQDASDDASDAESDDADDTGTGDAPAGKQLVTAEDSGATFAVADDWNIVDPNTVASDPDNPAAKAYADSLGIDSSQLSQVLAQVDVLVVAPGSTSNVNVVKVPGFTEVPEEAELEKQFGASNIEVASTEKVDTPLGEATVLHYKLPATTATQFGTGLFVATDNGVMNLTATSTSRDDADKLMEEIIPTLASAS